VDAILHAGFCPPTVELWLPIAPDYRQVNSGKSQLVRVAELGEGQMLLSTSLNRAGPINLAALQLQGHEGCIIELLDGE
jgi:hypothetical protein